ALVLSVIMLLFFWDRGQLTKDRLWFPAGWIIVAVVASAWPLVMIAEHGFKVVGLWAMHISARLSARTGHGTFAGEPWREYGLNILAEALPWTPLALIGAWQPFNRALRGYSCKTNRQRGSNPEARQVTSDRLLCSWAIGPLVLVSLASARNAHYAIYALVPWSIWAALGVAQLGSWQIAQG